MICLLKIRIFEVSYAGVYNSYGTKINMKVVLEVTDAPVTLKRQREWCDGRLVMDYAYPADQPATPIGVYTFEEKDYMHVAFLLPFSLTGHLYKIRLEYDTGYVEAECRFFTPTEMMALAGIGVFGACVLTLAVTKWLKWW